ncbi:hypothetical protein P3TCK_27524 [Photobacterium profundum 3TCK]|uniref:Uncharacterized protein n=1 Tax=Photobacterium profundum 3TCK TaxID=314280 RepID=Q1Z473_9GAMM|nr:hypothetical protein P3TCK_27524 [Photobacterium profundum 3TCK]
MARIFEKIISLYQPSFVELYKNGH